MSTKLKLPLVVQYNSHYDDYGLYESPPVDDRHGTNKIGDIYFNDHAAFICTAVNTYDVRTQWINDALSEFQAIIDTGGAVNMETVKRLAKGVE